MSSPSHRRNSRTRISTGTAAPPVAELEYPSPVAELEYPSLVAMEIVDAIEKRLFENPPTPDRFNLQRKAREARARVLALHEATIRADAVSKQGLFLQLIELDTAVDETIVLDDVASKMKRLIALIRQSVEALAPETDARVA